MDGSHATLRSLEELLNEFFGSATNNERKRQIEELLNQFALQDGSWIQCLFFLDNCANSYVHMYSLSILESLVNRRWHSFPGTDKQQVRKFLYNLLVSKHKEVAPFIRNKCIKVMVNIGRMDWPMFYPAFFSNIMQLVKEPNTTLIGVIALQMVSEEFISPREDLNMSRRNELKEQLLRHIPDAFRTLTEILNSFIHKSVSSTTVTPPPSPNQSSPFHTPQQSPHHSPVNHLMINGLFPIQRTGGTSDLDKNSKEICICIFSCLTQYISWLPLSQVITPVLVSKVFQFAEYGCNISMNADKSNCELGIHALSCINEIMSKKFIPAEYESFLMQMFQQTFNFLNTIIKEASGQQLSGFDESYLEKFTEFLSLFVSNHFSRFESHINLPTLELLTMLLKYTLAQESAELFMECLDIWVVVLDFLINKVTSCITANNKLAATQRYIDFLQQFLVQLLHKVQYCHNEKWLSQLDMEKVDSDVETEWEKFMKISLDVFGKISELIPEETFDHASQIFKQNIDIYFGLSSQLSNGELNIGHSEVQSLHSSMIDLSTSFRLMGRLSSIFTEEVTFQNRLGQANSTLDHLLKGALFGCYYKTSSVNCASLLSKDLIEVQSQAIGAVQAYIYWLTKLHMLVINNESHSEKFRAIISTVLDVICATIEPQLPSKIQLVGAHLLLSLSATVRPRFFLTLKQVQKLFSEINKIQELTDRNVKNIIFKGLSNALILPWPLTNSQEWEVREATHKMLISSICKDLYVDQQSLHQMQTVRWKDSVKCTFHILSEVVESVSNEGTQSRRIVYLSLKEILDLCLKLLVACVAEPDVAEEILQFLLASVKWLKVQMGSTFVEKIIQTLLTLLNREQMVEILKNGNPASCCVLEKFIKMLEIIVQDPDQSFKKLLPSILAFSLQNLLPALTECNFPDLNVELLELFHQLLLHNWRYFFKSDIVSKLNGADQLQHEQDLLGILKAYGDPLLKNEIFLFKKSLETLNSLNDKHRLFEKAIFQSSMLSSFLHVLLDILIQNSHGLLQEEIIHSVYSMVVYNFEAYFNQFIPHYLMNITGITDHQRMQLHANYKRHQDVPSFTTSLQQFVGDLRYYQIINSGIPSGSVQL